MYVLATGQAVTTFPYSVEALKRDNPQISFPDTVSDELLASFDVLPVVSTNPQFDRATETVEQNGCSYNADLNRWETAWIVRDKTAEEIQVDADTRAFEIRVERNSRLAQCDWTQLADAPLNADAKLAWQLYREALRMVPQQTDFPGTVQWPPQPV